VGRREGDGVLMLNGIHYFVEFDDGERVEVYDGLDAVRRLKRPGRITIQRMGGRVETVGWWTVNGGYERNPDFVSYGDDGETANRAEDNV
jgi:hypothetical protein